MKPTPNTLLGYSDQSGRCRFNTLKGFFLQDISSITHVTANGNYCDIHLINGSIKLITQTLAITQKNLEPHGFIRVGRSMMINANYLSQVDRQKNLCCLDLPSDRRVELKIANRHIKALSELF